MIVYLYWITEHLMTGVWTAYPYQKFIFLSNMADDVAFTFTPVLPADENVDEGRHRPGV